MPTTNNPCYKCTERHFKCHAECEKYADWKAEFEQLKQKRKNETEFFRYYVERKERKEKQKGKKHVL